MKLERYKQRDPKKIGITIFTAVCILLVAGVFFYTSFASFQTQEEFNIIKGIVGRRWYSKLLETYIVHNYV